MHELTKKILETLELASSDFDRYSKDYERRVNELDKLIVKLEEPPEVKVIVGDGSPVGDRIGHYWYRDASHRMGFSYKDSYDRFAAGYRYIKCDEPVFPPQEQPKPELKKYLDKKSNIIVWGFPVKNTTEYIATHDSLYHQSNLEEIKDEGNG